MPGDKRQIRDLKALPGVREDCCAQESMSVWSRSGVVVCSSGELMRALPWNMLTIWVITLAMNNYRMSEMKIVHWASSKDLHGPCAAGGHVGVLDPCSSPRTHWHLWSVLSPETRGFSWAVKGHMDACGSCSHQKHLESRQSMLR